MCNFQAYIGLHVLSDKNIRIDKGEEMKNQKKFYIFLTIFVFLIFSTTAFELFAYDSVVTGQSNPELDVKAVQEAVDMGGSVLLKGTFNFGQKGRVNIKKNVEVIGETDGIVVHSHRVSGGDKETRPKNKYVNWIIKY